MLRGTAVAHCGVRGPFEGGKTMRLIPWRELTALVRQRVGRANEDEQARQAARGGDEAERAESLYWSVFNDVRQVIDEVPRPPRRRRGRSG